MIKNGILALLLLTNGVALFCVFNPWFEGWAAPGILFLVLEAAFLLLIGVPVFFYHFARRNKPLRQSLEDSVRTVMDALVGWV